MFVFFVSSCQKELSTDEYAAYLTNPENGLRKDQMVKDFELSLMYEPSQYLTDENKPEERAYFEKNEHFQFRIKLIEGGNILTHNETEQQNKNTRINHFSYLVKEDFKLICGVDTNECKLAHYSRNYNLTATIDLTLSFNQTQKNQDWQIIYNDRQFKIGKVKFLFKHEDLVDLPNKKQ